MKGYLVVCFLLINFSSFAIPVKWYEGSLVLSDKTVMRGQISVEPIHNIVLFKDSETQQLDVYPAHRIHSFFYYDAEENINRKFISVKEFDGICKSIKLFEIVLTGEYTILRKQRTRTGKTPDHKNDFDYYIRKDSDLVALAQFKSKVYPSLIESSPEQIRCFVVTNGFNPHEPAHVIQIIKYYNRLVQYNALAGNF